MPTRITESSSTLTDNIFTNYLTDHNSSGMLYSDVSYHLPNFTILLDKTHKPESESRREISNKRISLCKK